MKMVLTIATTPDEYVACLRAMGAWQQHAVAALRDTVRTTAPGFDERLKWGHLAYFDNGPVLVIRAEPKRVLFAFMRGRHLRPIEPRLKPGGKYDLATLELRPDTQLERETVVQLTLEAQRLARRMGDPTAASR